VVLEVSQAAERGRTVRIFDVRGRLVRAWNERDALDANVIWDGRTAKGADAPSGIYFTRVSTPSGEATARTVLLR
jgi:flagellar hook assembly protein FlgD